MTKEEKFKFFCENYGKEVQVNDDGTWKNLRLLGFVDSTFVGQDGFHYDEARLKPQPKVISWTAETCPMPLYIRKKDWVEGTCLSVISVHKYCVEFLCKEISETNIGFEDLLDEWEQRDGSVCGQVIEGDEV